MRVITEAVYRANGVPGFGYVDRDRPAQIWIVPVPANASEKTTPAAVTTGEFAAANHRWSPDGTRLFFVSDRRRESYYYARDSDLYSIARDGGEPARVASIEGSIGAYALSPDGKRVAFVGTLVGNPERSYTQPDLWVAELGSGTPRNLTATLRLRRQRRHRRRPARAARPAPERTGLDPRRAHDPRRRRASRATPTSSASTRRPERSTASDHGQPRRHVVYRRRRRAEARHRPLHAHRARRSARARRRLTRGDEEADDVQRRAVRAAHDERAGGAVVHELRRPEDPGLDPQAAGVRGGEEVSAHPPDPRRPARRLRQHVHARVPVDGRPRATSSSTRTRAAARTTGRTSATSSSTTTRATTTRI